MAKTWQIVLAGAGGQGLVLAGAMLGEAAVIHEGKNATCAQAYGVASRGGFSRSEVIISDGDIAYPLVLRPDIVVALTSEAVARYQDQLASEGMMIVASCLESSTTPKRGRMIRLPLEEAAESAASRGSTNMVALGALARLSGVVTLESLARVAGDRFGDRGAGPRAALRAGWCLAAEGGVS